MNENRNEARGQNGQGRRTQKKKQVWNERNNLDDRVYEVEKGEPTSRDESKRT
jgi:hypothetical protein